MGLNVALASIISNQEIRTERKRQIGVKPPCAGAKEWHGMRHFRSRRRWRANSEALMLAAGQNLKWLLKKQD
jgi:hypothetical protein